MSLEARANQLPEAPCTCRGFLLFQGMPGCRGLARWTGAVCTAVPRPGTSIVPTVVRGGICLHGLHDPIEGIEPFRLNFFGPGWVE